MGTSYTVGGTINWYMNCQDPEIPLINLFPKETQTCVPGNMFKKMFIASLFIIAKWQKQSKCPSAGEKINTLCIHTMEHCSSEKNKTTITHINTDASSEHNAE